MIVALVGSDGSGKTTIATDLTRWLARRRAVRRCYLGLGTGNIGNRIKRVKLGGKWVERQLAKRADRARDAKDKIPGLPTAIVLYCLTLVRNRRFQQALRLKDAGYIVLSDRYPQDEVPGLYDGPLLSAARAEGRLIRRLAEKERRIYRDMVSHLPDLVVKLHVDVDTAMARKPDHKRKSIARKVEVTKALTFGGAHIENVDAREPYETVVAKVKAHVLDALRIPTEERADWLGDRSDSI